MDRQHLHGLVVGLQPAAALLVGLLLGRGDPRAQPGDQRGRAHLLGLGRGVQELADVAQVGQPALARRVREHAPGQALDERDRLGQRRHALLAQHARPVVQPLVHVLPRVVVGRGDLLGRPAEERRERGGVRAARVGRALDGRQQPHPVARRERAEDAARAVDDGGHADRVELVADERRVAVGAHEHGDVARADLHARVPGAVLVAALDLARPSSAAARGRRPGPWRCAPAPVRWTRSPGGSS